MGTEKYIESTDINPLKDGIVKTATEDGKTISIEEYKQLEQGFVEERKKMEDRVWLDSNLTRFDEILRINYDSSVKKFSENVISYISKITGAVHGAFFIVDHEDRLVKATAGYAVTLETMDRTQFNIGEGLIGQVAKSKEMLAIDDIETQLDSSLGRINASYLVVSPLVFNETCYGIIELTTLSKLKPRYLILLERVSRNIAAALQSIINNQKTKQFLNESLQQAEDYKVIQEEVLQKEKELAELRTQLNMKETALQDALKGIPVEQLFPNMVSNESLQQLTLELKEVKETLKIKEEELQSALAKINQLTEQIQDLQEKLVLLPASTSYEQGDEVESLHKKLEEAQKDLKAKDMLLQALIHKGNNSPNEQEQAGSQMASLKEQLMDLENEVQKRTKEVEMLRETVKWKDAEIDRQDEAILDRKKELKEAIENISAKEDEILKHLEEIIRQEKALQQKDAELEALLNRLEETQTSLADNQAIELLKNENAKLQEDLHNQQQELESALEQIMIERKHIALHLEEIEKYKQSLENQTQEFANFSEELNHRNNLIEELQANLIEEKSKLQEQVANIENIQSSLTKKEDELLVSQYLLNQMQNNPLASQEVDRLRQTVQQYDAQIQSLKAQLEENNQASISQADWDNLQNQLEDAFNANEQLKAQIAEIQAISDEKETLLNALKEQIKNQTNGISAEAEEFKSLIAQLHQKEQENLQQAELLETLRSQLFEKAEKLDDLQKSFEQNQSNLLNEDSFLQKLQDLEIIQENLKIKEEDIVKQYEIIESQKQDLIEKYQALEALKEQLQHNIQENLQQTSETVNPQEDGELEILRKEMKQKELELNDLFGKINTIFASIELDMSGNIMTVNNKFLMLLGLKLEDVQGHSYEHILLPSFVQSAEYRLLWEELKMGASQTVEGLVCLGNKHKEVAMSVTFVPILGEDGKPYEIVKLVNYIIEPKEEEEVVAEQVETIVIEMPTTQISQSSYEEQEKLRAVDNCFIITELDLEGNILHVNHQFSVFLGYEEAELKGKHHRNLIDITDRSSESYLSILESFPSGGFASEILKYVDKEGARVRLRSYFNPVKDEQGQAQKILVLSQFVN